MFWCHPWVVRASHIRYDSSLVSTKGPQTVFSGQRCLVIGRGLVGGAAVPAVGVAEGDAKSNLDLPAGDADLVDDEAEQGLFLREVEVVDYGEDALGEAGDAVAQLVVAGEFPTLGREVVSAVGEVATTVLDVGSPMLQFR